MPAHRLSSPGPGLTEASRPQIIVAQLGARMNYAVPVLLHRAGMLAHFYTDAYVGPGSSLNFLARLARGLPQGWQPAALKGFLARRANGLPAHKVTAFNYLGLTYARALRQAREEAARERIFLEYGRRFCDLVRQRGFPGAEGLYVCQSAAVPLFREAQEHGIRRILEQFSYPTALAWPLLAEEYQGWPGWEPPYPGREVWEPRIAMEEEEWGLAEAILSPSAFVAQGLLALGVPGEKVHEVPYGSETTEFGGPRPPWDGRRPLRALFVGAVSLRKGCQYFYQALEKLNSSQLSARLVGPVAIREPYRGLLKRRLELVGQVPRTEVWRHYAWADVFVFPALCEGSATVVYEALAAGLPVITTPNAGSVVQDGVEGFIVPSREAEGIARGLEKLALSPARLEDMSRRARARAQAFSWERYGERLTGCLGQLCSPSSRATPPG